MEEVRVQKALGDAEARRKLELAQAQNAHLANMAVLGDRRVDELGSKLSLAQAQNKHLADMAALGDRHVDELGWWKTQPCKRSNRTPRGEGTRAAERGKSCIRRTCHGGARTQDKLGRKQRSEVRS